MKPRLNPGEDNVSVNVNKKRKEKCNKIHWSSLSLISCSEEKSKLSALSPGFKNESSYFFFLTILDNNLRYWSQQS